MNNKILGDKGEQIAVEHLKKNKYLILETNWRVGRFEIDIIALKKNYLIFVEVKTRNTAYFGFPEAAVQSEKKNFLSKAANAYIRLKQLDYENRFDIISIIMTKNSYELEHIEDAFYPFY